MSREWQLFATYMAQFAGAGFVAGAALFSSWEVRGMILAGIVLWFGARLVRAKWLS